MKIITIYKQEWLATVLAIAITLFISAAPSYAGIVGDGHKPTEATEGLGNGGNVLPPKAEPNGYSLSDIAKLTAAFNVIDPYHPAPFPNVVNGRPFQGLFYNTTNTFDVSEGTMLYVPILSNRS